VTKKRVVIIAFGLESSTFTPLVATRETFNIRHDNFCSKELLKIFTDADVEPMPIMLVSGTPNGLVPVADFQSIEDEVFSKLSEAGKADGFLLSMHGSMLLDSLEHGELHFLRRLRKVLGSDVPVSVRLDLHGNIPDGFVELCDSVTALRTAPHRDNLETILRAARLLIRMLNGEPKPLSYLCRLPILIPGEWAVTECEPARSLYALIDRLEAEDKQIWSASVMVGFAWADVPWAGASIIVSASTELSATEAAHKLAREFWNRRCDFGYDGECYYPEQALEEALRSTNKPVFLMETGDNITAGSTGIDGNLLLKLIERNFQNTLYLQFFDEKFTSTCSSLKAGSKVTFSVHHGACLAEISEIEAMLLKVVQIQGTTCCLLKYADITFMVTSKRVPIAEEDKIAALDLKLTQFKYVVCKLGYLLPYLYDISSRSINVLTSGPTSPDIFQFKYERVRRPIFPLDKEVPEPDYF
jgi:microcystin degradation protein MlrC